MGRSIRSFAFLASVLLLLTACAGTESGHLTTLPIKLTATATSTSINRLSVGAFAATGFVGAVDNGTVNLTPTLSHRGWLIGKTEDNGVLILASNPTSSQPIQVWYPATDTTATIAPAIPGMLPRQPGITANATWSAVVYQPSSNAQQNAGNLTGSGWQLFIFNRKTQQRTLLSKDAIGDNLPSGWNTSISPDISLSGDNLLWREYVPRGRAIHSIVHLTNLNTMQTTDLLDIISSDLSRFIFSPTISGHLAAWCDQHDLDLDPKQLDIDRAITIFDINQNKIIQTNHLNAQAHTGACTPVLNGNLLAFSLYANDDSIYGIAYKDLATETTEIVANDAGQPNGPSAGSSLVGWSIFQPSLPIAYNLKTHQRYLANNTMPTSGIAVGNIIIWQENIGSPTSSAPINAQIVG